jgi:hypothetical protein
MPITLFETPTLDRRRHCECCGAPSLSVPDGTDGRPDWGMSTNACNLCEWVSRPLTDAGEPSEEESDEERNDGLTLERARANIERHGSIYDPADLPAWKLAPPSPDVVSTRSTLRGAYSALDSDARVTPWDRWAAVTEAEYAVRDALAAQQAADEASVADAWDDEEDDAP